MHSSYQLDLLEDSGRDQERTVSKLTMYSVALQAKEPASVGQMPLHTASAQTAPPYVGGTGFATTVRREDHPHLADFTDVSPTSLLETPVT